MSASTVSVAPRSVQAPAALVLYSPYIWFVRILTAPALDAFSSSVATPSASSSPASSMATASLLDIPNVEVVYYHDDPEREYFLKVSFKMKCAVDVPMNLMYGFWAGTHPSLLLNAQLFVPVLSAIARLANRGYADM